MSFPSESVSVLWSIFQVFAISSAVIWMSAFALAALLRRSSAAVRHRLWAFSMLAVLLAPVAAPWLPRLPWAKSESSNIPASHPQPQTTALSIVAPQNRPVSTSQPISDTRPSFQLQPTAPASARMAPAIRPAAGVIAHPGSENAKPSSLNWPRTIAFVWIAGLALGLLALVRECLIVWKIRRRATALTESSVATIIQNLSDQQDVRRRITVLLSGDAAVPFVTGFRGAIVLPADFLNETPERQRVVLLHELLHIVRQDVAWHLVGRLAVAAVWFNPLGWLALNRLRIERELACDDAVLLSGNVPSQYAGHLVSVAAAMRNKAGLIPAVGMARGSEVEKRIRAILDPNLIRRPVSVLNTAMLSLSLLVILALGALVMPSRAEPPAKKKSTARTSENPPAAERDGAVPQAAQDATLLNRKVSLHATATPLLDALGLISQQLHVPIIVERRTFSASGVSFFEKRDVELDNRNLGEAIPSLFQGPDGKKFDIDCRVQEGRIVIRAAVPAPDLSHHAYKGRVTVKGVVKGSDGKPAANTLIQTRGFAEDQLTTAGPDGEFELSLLRDEFRMTVFVTARDPRSGLIDQVRLAQYGSETFDVPPVTLTLQEPRTLSVLVDQAEGSVGVPDATVAVCSEMQILETARTDGSGIAHFSFPQSQKIDEIFAMKSGLGLDYHSYQEPRNTSDLLRPPVEQPRGRISLRLGGARRLTFHIKDDEQRPIEGLSFRPWYFTKPEEPNDLNIASELFVQKSDANGTVVFDWLPEWDHSVWTFWPDSKKHARSRVTVDTKSLDDKPIEVTLNRLVEAGGRVLNPDGSPVSGATVLAVGKGYDFDGFNSQATTGPDGSYRLELAPYQTYLILARQEQAQEHLAATPQDGILVYPNQPQTGLDFTLQPATRIHGRVTRGDDHQPMAEQYVSIYQYGRDLNNRADANFPKPDDDRARYWIQPMSVRSVHTDKDGQYELWGGPGEFDVRGPESNTSRFQITNQSEVAFDFHVAGKNPSFEQAPLDGQVFMGDSPESVQANIAGFARHTAGGELSAKTNEKGQFRLTRRQVATVLRAETSDHKYAGIVEVGPEEKTATIRMAPVATYSARMVDESGAPCPTGVQIQYGIQYRLDDDNRLSQTRFGKTLDLDDTATVRFENLVLGQTYEVTHVHDGTYYKVTKITPEKAGEFDLGDLVVPPLPKPYVPPTLAERIQSTFERPNSPLERHTAVQADMKLSPLLELITFANPQQSPILEPLYRLFYEDKDIRGVLNNYRQVAISTHPDKRAAAQELAAKLGVELPDGENALLVVVDLSGKAIATVHPESAPTPDRADPNGKPAVDRDRLLELLRSKAPAPLDAQQLLSDALARAKTENKRVLIQETATWCGPCWMLSRFLDRHRENWEKDFIWVKMDERWTGRDDVMKTIRKEVSGGIPWLAILDAEGNVLGTSTDDGQPNYGFPTEPDEIQRFVKLLRQTGTRFTENDATAIADALGKKAK
jgi:beta-lactamase regulating signal transducer with metallopeptidase domain